MENSSSLPDVKSAKLMHISELPQWYGDEVHGNSVRVLGRIVKVDVANDVIDVEYHGARLRVCSKLLDGGYGGFMPGTLFQFLGELERNSQRAGEVCIPPHPLFRFVFFFKIIIIIGAGVCWRLIRRDSL